MAQCFQRGGAAQHILKSLPLRQRFFHQIAEPVLADLLRQKGDGGADLVGFRAGEHMILRLLQEKRLFLIFNHGKGRRDIGLKGKEMQQPLAKSVNGLNFQAAGGFHRLGKQAARMVQQFCARCVLHRHRLAEIFKRSHQGRVIKLCPLRQGVENAGRHIGRRHLCIGEAENARRINAAQQQADDAHGQNIGFARASIG